MKQGCKDLDICSVEDINSDAGLPTSLGWDGTAEVLPEAVLFSVDSIPAESEEEGKEAAFRDSSEAW